jgi:hypothetical protein
VIESQGLEADDNGRLGFDSWFRNVRSGGANGFETNPPLKAQPNTLLAYFESIALSNAYVGQNRRVWLRLLMRNNLLSSAKNALRDADSKGYPAPFPSPKFLEQLFRAIDRVGVPPFFKPYAAPFYAVMA